MRAIYIAVVCSLIGCGRPAGPKAAKEWLNKATDAAYYRDIRCGGRYCQITTGHRVYDLECSGGVYKL